MFFPCVIGVPPEDFLCISEPDENECLSSRLDGDEVADQQVSREAGTNCWYSVSEFFLLSRAIKTQSPVCFIRLGCGHEDSNSRVLILFC